MGRPNLEKDVPRRSKLRGWKKEFLESLAAAAKDIGEVSDKKISRTVWKYRKEKRAPDNTVAAKV